MRSRGWPAYALAMALLTFYLVLYFTDVFTPLAQVVWAGADKWTLYGLLYTQAILVGGVVFVVRNRRSTYQVRRTLAIMAVAILIGRPIQPIEPMTSTMGNRLGTSEINPIDRLRKAMVIIVPMPIAASTKLTS